MAVSPRKSLSLAAILGALLLATAAPGCGVGRSHHKPNHILVLLAPGPEDGAIVVLNGIEMGHLARLPPLTSLDRLVLRIARSLGILDVDPDARVPDLAMLKVSLDGAIAGAHTVSVQSPTGRTYVRSFNYPDQLVADTILISIDAEALAKEMFGEGEPCDQPPPASAVDPES